MKTGILIVFLAGFSMNLMAKTVTKALIGDEIQLAIELTDKYAVPLQEIDSLCTKTEFEIVDRVRGFNPASWTLVSGEEVYELEQEEVSELIKIHNRLNVPAKNINSITLESRMTIKGETCGFNPSKWTVSYDDGAEVQPKEEKKTYLQLILIFLRGY